jgi:hypothetical protein
VHKKWQETSNIVLDDLIPSTAHLKIEEDTSTTLESADLSPDDNSNSSSRTITDAVVDSSNSPATTGHTVVSRMPSL